MNWKMFNDDEIFGKKPFADRKLRNTVSPYLIPQAYRVYIDKINQTVNLEFKYISDDIYFITKKVSESSFILYGEESNRIFKISLLMKDLSDDKELLQHLSVVQKFLESKVSKSKESKASIESKLFNSRVNDVVHETK